MLERYLHYRSVCTGEMPQYWGGICIREVSAWRGIRIRIMRDVRTWHIVHDIVLLNYLTHLSTSAKKRSPAESETRDPSR